MLMSIWDRLVIPASLLAGDGAGALPPGSRVALRLLMFVYYSAWFLEWVLKKEDCQHLTGGKANKRLRGYHNNSDGR